MKKDINPLKRFTDFEVILQIEVRLYTDFHDILPVRYINLKKFKNYKGESTFITHGEKASGSIFKVDLQYVFVQEIRFILPRAFLILILII